MNISKWKTTEPLPRSISACLQVYASSVAVLSVARIHDYGKRFRCRQNYGEFHLGYSFIEAMTPQVSQQAQTIACKPTGQVTPPYHYERITSS